MSSFLLFDVYVCIKWVKQEFNWMKFAECMDNGRDGMHSGCFYSFFSLFARIYLRFGCDLFCIQRRRYINLNKWSIHITRIYSRHTACAVFFVFSAFVNNSLKLWNDEKKIQFIMDFRLVFQANIHHFMNFFCVCINIFKRWKHFKCLD